MPLDPLLIALPKGRIYQGVANLLAQAGISITTGARSYRPAISLPNCDAKILKPQSVVEMLHLGSRDLGFAGADWVEELDANLVELVDTELDPVRVVAAGLPGVLRDRKGEGDERKTPLRVASEYERLTRRWVAERGIDAVFVRSYGATEVYPPEAADCIVDNTATGATLRANGLEIFDEITRSSTRLYASPRALDDADKRRAIEEIALIVRAVVAANKRVMVEVNVAADALEAVIAVLPAMRQPTVASLHGDEGFAVKAAVPRSSLPSLVNALARAGGSDIVVTTPTQIVA